jgi:hypothetical protein
MTTAADRDSGRLNEALWLVLRRYGRQITRRPMIALPALVLPGIGDVLVFYLSTVRRMDSLAVLDRGCIVERGTHENLLVRDGIYASLWSHQSGGFLPATDVENVAVYEN